MRCSGIFRKVRYSELQIKILQERSHEVATTCTRRNWPQLLADYVASTGRGSTGDGLMSGALVRVGLGLCVLYGVTLLSMLFYSVTTKHAGAMSVTS